jgi:hypothetical protein
MKAPVTTLAGLLLAGGVSLAIAAAPSAAANPPLLPQCVQTGGSSVMGGQTTECETPGNAQIDATPPVVPNYGMYPWDDEYFVL